MSKPRHSRLDCAPGCAVEATISLIDGKWKCIILYHLMDGTIRFNEMCRRIPNATQRVLTNQLRELEEDGLVLRKAYAQVPPKVEYSLSDLGHSMAPILRSLKDWGDANLPLLSRKSRVSYFSDFEDVAAGRRT
jgi:DNA-binding HxlR family transcriptional regulator